MNTRFVILSLTMLLASAVNTNAQESRPNILFIMSDDHAAHAISAYGGRLADVAPTPNLDRLASEGMRFTNAFVTNSICTPSRAVIWTGKYSHVNGVYKFTGLDQSQPTLPKYMQAHGYQTGFVGKYHLHTNPRGFDHWSILPGQGRYHNTAFVEMGDEHESGIVARGKRTTNDGWHSTDIITQKALDWFRTSVIRSARFSTCCITKRLMMFGSTRIATTTTWLMSRSRNREIYTTTAVDGRPRWTFPRKSSAARPPTRGLPKKFVRCRPGGAKREFVYQEYMKRYLRCVKGIDDNLGKVLQYLDDSGLDGEHRGVLHR